MSDIDYQEKQLRAAWHDELYVFGHNPIEPYHGVSFYLTVAEDRRGFPIRRLFYFSDQTRLPGESYDAFRARMVYESWAWVI